MLRLRLVGTRAGVASEWQRRVSTGAAGAGAPSNHEDEIEKKFAPLPVTLARIRGLGVAPVTKVFSDRYFDTEEYALTRRDMWLRRRNSAVELKWPMTGSHSSGAQAVPGIDYYHESRDWPTIADAARTVAGVDLVAPLPVPGASPPDVERWLHTNGVRLFGELRTTRQRYAITMPVRSGAVTAASSSSHSLHIDIDAVSFTAIVSESHVGTVGRRSAPDPASSAHPASAQQVPPGPDHAQCDYVIGEVELVQAGGGLTPSAAMADVFHQLAINPAPGTRGKVLEYLARQRPQHYAALGRAGLLASKLGPASGSYAEVER